MIILITYDLNKPDKDYNSLFEAIKQLGDAWWHYLKSVWIVRTSLTPAECSERLLRVMDRDDSLFVVDITSQQRQGWLPSKAWEWFKDNQ